MNASELRSPFVDRVINLIPQGHEDAMKQAFYNVAAICLFIALGGAAMSVYFILEPFVKPLLWAILIGSVLHPLKQRSVTVAKSWLCQLSDDNTPLIFGFLTVPLRALHLIAEWLEVLMSTHLKLILLSTFLGLPLVSIIQNYSFSDLISIYEQIAEFLDHVSLVERILNPIAGTVLFGFFGFLLVVSTNHRLHVIAITGWLITFYTLLTFMGSLSVVFLFATLLLVLLSFALQWGWIIMEEDSSKIHTPARNQVTVNFNSPLQSNSLSRLMKSHIVTAAINSLSTPSPQVAATPSTTVRTSSLNSNKYIFRALWACLAVKICRHMWLLVPLIPIPLVCLLVKAGGSYFNVWTFLQSQKCKLSKHLAHWLDKYQDEIFPKPLQWMYMAIVYLDRMFIKRLIKQIDAVVTVLLIIVVVVFTVLASAFVAIQIYGESVHLLQLGTSLVNQTVNHPEARQWLPQGVDKMIDLGAVVDNAYSYGKSGIASLVKNTINEKDPARAAQIELAILETLDRVQRAWLTQGDPHSYKRNQTEDNLSINFTATVKPPLLRRLSQDFLNITVLVNYGKENVGSIFSILDSIWTILKGNLSLVIKSTTAVMSILMGGGTAILNFLVGGVVFLTALYYLLVASDSQYKPIQLVSFLTPGGGNTLGTAMEEAINTVCMASLKLAAFYGLWTWLIHTIFRVNFCVIPAALAALLGAVPFLGTYWAALPAALDLWLAQRRGEEAVLLVIFQFVPTILIDAAFYAEIKGGGHPYLTGLAVAGGIFWLGFEGAIIGPLLLCVLLVVVSVYTQLVQNESQPTPIDANSRWFHRRLLRTDTVG